jgi:type IV pilus assembly protein PilP
MKTALKVWRQLFAVVFVTFVAQGALLAQEHPQTPSQKTKGAVDKFREAPTTLGKKFQGLTDAARAKLQQVLGRKPNADANRDSGDVNPPTGKTEPAAERFAPAGTRDPFLPFNLKTKANSQPRQNLSPLERFELGQLKIVGIVWDSKEPRAMVEDTAGLGYIVKVGTPIGNSEGKVKSIHRNEIIVEESYKDIHDAKRKRDVSMKLSTE